MKSALLRWCRELVPPALARPLARRFLGVRYTGDYASWAEARRASTGYDTAEILARVTAAARAVRDGRAAYERDGVAFTEPAYRWPLLSCLLAEANRHGGRLRVLDFGGALGSVYFQHRMLLRGMEELRWAVVEQPMFVETGRREFTTPELGFHSTVAEAAAAIAPDVILFSGVLGWVEDPAAVIGEALRVAPAAILIDRTPLTEMDRDVIKLQRVPASIYRASYPCRFLSRRKLLARFAPDYTVRAELPQAEDAPVPGVTFGGFYLGRNGPGR